MLTFRQAIEAFDTERAGNPTWNIDNKTGMLLQALITENNYTSALEIGTSTGYSALHIANALSQTDGSLVTVESHPERFTIAKERFASLSDSARITQVQGHAPEILDEISGTFDFIFLDATKYEHVSYVEALKSRLKSGGMIVSDNMLSHKEQMQPLLELMEANKSFSCELLEIGTGLLVSKNEA